MGQNSRARRAAKQRRNQRSTGRRPGGGRWEFRWPDSDGGPTGGAAPDPAGTARARLESAVRHSSLGLAPTEDIGALLELPGEIVERAVDVLLGESLRHVFAGGWSPIDLVEIYRRRIDVGIASLMLDSIAAATADYPEALVDAGWRAQLAELGARVWWDRRRPYLAQWAARDHRPRTEALGATVALLGLCHGLPTIETVLPPPGRPARPGSGTAPGPTRTDETQEKVLAKVRALLAKAEATDFDDEAEALSAKAQELMSRYAIDRALLGHRQHVGQHAVLRRIWLDAPYVVAKSMLVDAVAGANRCRTVMSQQWGYATVIGDEVDLQLVELLATSLLLQATRAMVSSGSQVSRSGISRTRSYRQSFLVAYAARIGERLHAVNRASESATDDAAWLPVLSARSRAVDQLLAEQFPHLVSKQVSVGNAAGWGAGRAAADLARLDVRDSLSQAG